MILWSPQQYKSEARDLGKDPEAVKRAIATAEQITAVNANLPPIFTLPHLAYLTKADYRFLRATVARSHNEPYRSFVFEKERRIPENSVSG